MLKILFSSLSFFICLSCFAQNVSYFGSYAGGTGPNGLNLYRATAIGYNAKVSVDDGLVLGDTSLVKVGIGLPNPEYKLDVRGIVNVRMQPGLSFFKINKEDFMELDENGEIILNRFRIKYDHELMWSDKVFDAQYELMSLQHTKKFIEKNHHLPNIPSAKEVVEKGVNMNEMIALLLEKVEELTLHTIAQQEEIEALKTCTKGLK